MRFKILSLSLLLSFSALSAQLTSQYSPAGIEFYTTSELKQLTLEGSNVRYHLSNPKVFATSFIYTDHKNDYPLLAAFSSQMRDRIYPPNDYSHRASKRLIHGFDSVDISNISYLVESKAGQCELFISSAIGNRSYLFTSITTEVDKKTCKRDEDNLFDYASIIAAGIKVKKLN